MSKPLEIYQVQQINSNNVADLQRLVNELNQYLFEISKRLGTLSIPQDTSDASTVSDIITLLESAGIGES
jgi:hypothetical protein